MLVRELIEKLNEIEDKELPIVLETDHGQTPMHLTFVGDGSDVVTDTEDYMMDYAWTDEDEPDPDGDKVVVLQAY